MATVGVNGLILPDSSFVMFIVLFEQRS